MKQDDQYSDQEIKQLMEDLSDSILESSEAQLTIFSPIKTESYQDDLNGYAYGEIVSSEPAIEAAIPLEKYEGIKEKDILSGANNREATFNEGRRRFAAALASGVDQVAQHFVQGMADLIDQLAELNSQVGAEAAELSASAAASLLVPVNPEDFDSFSAEIEEARVLARTTRAELENSVARRKAVKASEDGTDTDLSPELLTVPGRHLERAELTPVEGQDEVGVALVAGRPGQSRASIARNQVERLREITKAPMLNRISYVAICGSIGNLSRLREITARATSTVKSLLEARDGILNVLSGDFAIDVQTELEKRAAEAVGTAEGILQEVADFAAGFRGLQPGLPGPFVSTVNAIGDVPSSGPVLSAVSSICGLKAEKFCGLQGVIEVAKSLDIELGLDVEVPAMNGTSQMTLDAPEASQAPPEQVSPGQEADLILVSLSGNTLVARFSRESAPVAFSNGVFTEKPDVFGDGDGEITLLGLGEMPDQVVPYTAVSYDSNTNNYTFTLSSAQTSRIQSARAVVDELELDIGPGVWDELTLYPPGVSAITLRIPESQRRDLAFPIKIGLGSGEVVVTTGMYDTLGLPNTISKAYPAVFETWMVGSPIDLGKASADGQAQTRNIVSIVGAGEAAYSGTNVPAISGNTGSFRLSANRHEIVTANGMIAGASADLWQVTLTSTTVKPHDRLRLVHQLSVRVKPTVRDDFLDVAETPADPDVRNLPILPAGSTVVLATFTSQVEAAIVTPIILLSGSGGISIDGGGLLAYSSVTDEGNGQMRFVLSDPTPAPFFAGVSVDVQTVSLRDKFSDIFPDSFFETLDTWLYSLGVQLNSLESKICRLLSGRAQDVAFTAAAISALTVPVTGLLAIARAFLAMWIRPLASTTSPAATGALARFDASGSDRAAAAIRKGDMKTFFSMDPEDSSSESALLAAAQNLKDRADTFDQRAVIAIIEATVRARLEALYAAGSVVAGGFEEASREIAQTQAIIGSTSEYDVYMQSMKADQERKKQAAMVIKSKVSSVK